MQPDETPHTSRRRFVAAGLSVAFIRPTTMATPTKPDVVESLDAAAFDVLDWWDDDRAVVVKYRTQLDAIPHDMKAAQEVVAAEDGFERDVWFVVEYADRDGTSSYRFRSEWVEKVRSGEWDSVGNVSGEMPDSTFLEKAAYSFYTWDIPEGEWSDGGGS